MFSSRFLCGLAALCCLFTIPAIGNWSMPPEVIYTVSPPDEINGTSIATDGNGNSVAVWFDSTGTGSMQSATLASGAVNAQGQPAWNVLATPIVASNIETDYEVLPQRVGVDFNGNATAVWTDETYVYVSILPFGQSTWSAPVIVSTPILGAPVHNPQIAVNPNGDIIVTWASQIGVAGNYEFSAIANVYDATSQTWRGQIDVLSGATVQSTNATDYVPAAINEVGNGVIYLINASNDTLLVRYNFDTNVWTQIPSVATNSIIALSAVIDSGSNVTTVWQENNGNIVAASLPFNETTLTNINVLSTTALTGIGGLAATPTASGGVVAAWGDASGNLASGRYSLESNTWAILPLFDTGDAVFFPISISADQLGSVVVTGIGLQLPDKEVVQTAELLAYETSWSHLTTIYTATVTMQIIPQVIVTKKGDAIELWSVTDGSSGGSTLYSSIFLNIFAPPPPSYFIGRVTKTKFLTQTDRIHFLTWGASPDPQVVEYRLYRNSVLIATLPAIGQTFSYQDHNRNKKVSDTYMVVAVNSLGEEGSPLFVTLQ